MPKKFKTQDEIDTENAMGTLRQLAFFRALESSGTPVESCVDILTKNLPLPNNEALRLLYRIGRSYDSDKPMPLDLEKYLIERGKVLL